MSCIPVGSKLTTLAKSLLRMCKWEMEEIETCPDCYGNAYVSDNWFTMACVSRRYLSPNVGRRRGTWDASKKKITGMMTSYVSYWVIVLSRSDLSALSCDVDEIRSKSCISILAQDNMAPQYLPAEDTAFLRIIAGSIVRHRIPL